MEDMTLTAFDNLGAKYPKFFGMADRVMTLDQVGIFCIVDPLKGKPPAWDDRICFSVRGILHFCRIFLFSHRGNHRGRRNDLGGWPLCRRSKGQTLFDNRCSFCHYADRTNSKMGPGLKGVLKGEKLPYSGRPATSENVKQQIRNPISTMPSFASLSEEDIAALLAYLKTL